MAMATSFKIRMDDFLCRPQACRARRTKPKQMKAPPADGAAFSFVQEEILSAAGGLLLRELVLALAQL